MRRVGLKLGFAFWLASLIVCGVLRAQTPQQTSQGTTIDRIVARVDVDIILLSDVKALERYQQLVDGKSESDDYAFEKKRTLPTVKPPAKP